MNVWQRRGRWWVHRETGQRLPAIGGGGGTPILVQTHALFRNDDGSETTATGVAAEDTNASFAVDTNLRVRLEISNNTGGGNSSDSTTVLRYSLNGGAYTVVSASSTVARSSASPNVADGAATTTQLTAVGTAFVAGSFDEVDGVTATMTITDPNRTEMEWCIQLRSADVTGGDTIDFRAYRATTALNSYTVTPRITIAGGGATGQPTMRRTSGIPGMSYTGRGSW